MRLLLRIARASLLVLLAASATVLSAQDVSTALYSGMRWRSIGPFRGGRTRAVAGVPSQPNVFYIGVCNGGVWKTTDFGHTWTPIFDSQPTGSIGAAAVAESDPNIVYVASGEGLQRPDLSVGDGIYKSTDAGRTWTHLGLRDGQQIPAIAVDPRDPNRLFVAVLGHPYGPNPERGIFRSTDGGRTFAKVLYKDENTGGSDVKMDPSDPNVLYAGLLESRQGPWENGVWTGTNGGLFKSTDGGATWKQLTNGLPPVVQAHVTVSPANPKRLYAVIAGSGPGQSLALYRSDDAGENWIQTTTDTRPMQRAGETSPQADPKNPDLVYIVSIVTWKSTDAGKTWTAIRGAPGGDDYQSMWINPSNPDIILLSADQGAIITVNGGQTWSSWYNQPTAQFYHVNTDNAFPYRVCGGQQESGSACVSSRGNYGEITFREWTPVAVEEYGYAVPDPRDPDMVYGGKISRWDRRTAQVENISPKPNRGPDYRVLRTQPVAFSPKDPQTLFFASNTVWKTRDGGRSWQQVSPDLTRKTYEVPASIGKYRDQPSARATQRGVIYALAPSPLDVNVIWAGTDDGLIHLTSDGGANWKDVTPPALGPFAKVSILEAGHFDAQTAYAAINTLRLDDMRPHIFRTHDGGKTWTEIRSGIPDGEASDAVREDPKRKGLLFASTERAVYFSLDDGDRWQSLRLNMPATSVRDIVIKDDDLVAGTHGRGFWILDDITPLRQINAKVEAADAFLFAPQTATRVRWNMNTDTPLPPDFPAGENPPDGAVINYFLKAGATGPMTIEILDSAGKLVRSYSSADPLPPPDRNLLIPTYWVRPPQTVGTSARMHRFLWDLHYTPVPGGRESYPIAAVPHNTVPDPNAPWVMPGQYTVRLTVNGRSYTQPLTVRMDPRVKTPPAEIAQQFKVSKQLYDDAMAATTASTQAAALRAQLQELRQRVTEGPVADAITTFTQKLQAVAGAGEGGGGRRGGGGGGGRFGGGSGEQTLGSVRSSSESLMRIVQEADVAPTTQVAAAIAEAAKASAAVLKRWEEVKTTDLHVLNTALTAAGQRPLGLTAPPARGSNLIVR